MSCQYCNCEKELEYGKTKIGAKLGGRQQSCYIANWDNSGAYWIVETEPRYYPNSQGGLDYRPSYHRSIFLHYCPNCGRPLF